MAGSPCVQEVTDTPRPRCAASVTRTNDHPPKNEKDITEAVPSRLQTTRAYSSLGCPGMIKTQWLMSLLLVSSNISSRPGAELARLSDHQGPLGRLGTWARGSSGHWLWQSLSIA